MRLWARIRYAALISMFPHQIENRVCSVALVCVDGLDDVLYRRAIEIKDESDRYRGNMIRARISVAVYHLSKETLKVVDSTQKTSEERYDRVVCSACVMLGERDRTERRQAEEKEKRRVEEELILGEIV
ncbi:hypothetical protein Tco_1466972 [Tanacetum coccineum]